MKRVIRPGGHLGIGGLLEEAYGDISQIMEVGRMEPVSRHSVLTLYWSARKR